MVVTRFEGVLSLLAMVACASCGKTRHDASESPNADAGRGGQTNNTGSGGTRQGDPLGGASGNGQAGNGQGGNEQGDDVTDAPGLGCAGWEVHTTEGNPSSASIVDGALLLQRSAAAETPLFGFYNRADVAVAQGGLSGDFEITVDWEDFQPADAVPFVGPRVQAGIWREDETNTFVAQANASVGQTTGEAVIVHGDQFTANYLDPSPSPESLVGASGSFHIARSGTFVFVETVVNGQTVSAASTEPFPDEPLTLFLSIDNFSDREMATDASIKISKVTVTDGGGLVKSDDFSCP